jgi:Lipase (class 3)
MTPLDLAKLNALAYASPLGWTHYWVIDEVIVCHTVVDGQDVLVLPGSRTALDWMRDMNAMPVWHHNLGFVHAGFLMGLDDVYAEVKSVVKNPLITGHSLGGSRARILAGMFAYDAFPVDTLCVFGSPKPAFINLQRIITKSGMKHLSFRNRNDPVPTVPFTMDLIFQYCHTEDWVAVDAAPTPDDLEPLRDHHIGLYIQGLTALFPPV